MKHKKKTQTIRLGWCIDRWWQCKMMKRNKKVIPFFLIWIPIVILTFISLWFAAARDEGMIGEGLMKNFVADLFYVFRFPTHPLLWDWMDNNPLFFFPGLMINTVFNSLIIYLLINLKPILNGNMMIGENRK